MGDKVTAPRIAAMKRSGNKVVCLTAYDSPSGRLADNSGADLVLVGDSLGNVALGFDSTLPVTMDHMLHHLAAVRRSVSRALLVVDMPFLSYQASIEDAVRNAGRFMQVGAEAVKLEGGRSQADTIRRLVDIGIPVMGHVGMTPQSVNRFGGYRVQGRGTQAEAVVADAIAVEQAGAFSVVLELIPAAVAGRVTHQLSIPTIGIGAGPQCDGEIQVFHDLVGLGREEIFRHTKRYADCNSVIAQALRRYVVEVREGQFPTDENSA